VVPDPVTGARSSFASDNHAGVPPQVLAAIAEANRDHAPAYGADPWTARVEQCFREQLGEQATAFLVFNGTAANVLALRATCRPWEGVICAASAHIQVDECGAPERIAGVKLYPAPTPDGKLTAAQIDPLLVGVGDEHHTQMRLVSVSQSTELGTCYSPAELRALSEHAHARGLLVHVDGARIANAAVSLGVPLRAITTDAGVDVVSFGGTKLGLLGAEAVVFLRPDLVENFHYLRKQSLQLASKGRFLAAQFLALFEDDLWRLLAAHANAMAARLGDGVRELENVTITQPVQANAVFATIPRAAIAPLQAEWPFHVRDESSREVRWMCSWDTTPAAVDAFIAAIAAAVAG
jgi:threonine aldolase